MWATLARERPGRARWRAAAQAPARSAPAGASDAVCAAPGRPRARGRAQRRCQRNRFWIAGALGDQLARGDRRAAGSPSRAHPGTRPRSARPRPDNGSRDRERVDRVRLAGLALASARGARQLRRHPDHLLAGRSAAPARAAWTRAGSPRAPTRRSPSRSAPNASRRRARHRSASIVALAATCARSPASTAASACVRLWMSAPITIICTSLRCAADEADLRRTYLTWGDATLLSSHARGPRTAAGDTTLRVRPSGRQA